MKRFSIILTAIATMAMVVGCTNDGGGVKGVKHVVMIGLDGLAGNTVEAADMPTVKGMMAGGAWTLQARSILPSSSACNWASAYMGVGPEMHGYNTWGSRTPDFPSIAVGKNGIFPTIFTVLREHNPEINTSAFYEWDVQGDLIDNKAVSYHQHVPMGESRSADITNAYTAYLKEHQPEFSLCVFDSPDAEGHSYGWGSEEYMNRLPEVDAYIAQIVEATKEAGMYDETIFIIISDHGGINKGHGSTSMDEMEAVLIFCGPGIKKGYKIDVPVVRYDTAPTIAYILGAKTPDVWRGRPIFDAFEQ